MKGTRRNLIALLVGLATFGIGTALAASTSTSQYLQQLQTDQSVTQSSVNTAATGSQNLDVSLSGLSGYTAITRPLAWSPTALPGVADSAGQTTPNYPIGTTPSLASQIMGQQFGGKRAVCLSGDTRYGPPYYGGHVGSTYCKGAYSHWEYSQAHVQALSNGDAQLSLLFDYGWHTVNFALDKPFTYQLTNGTLGVQFVYKGAVNGTMTLTRMAYGTALVPGVGWSTGWHYYPMAYGNFQVSQTPYGHYWSGQQSSGTGFLGGLNCVNDPTLPCSTTETTVSG